MNGDIADVSSLGLYDAEVFRPPPPGEEYPRPPSPPTSEHSSQCEDFNSSKYGSVRNAAVEDYLNEEKNKVPLEPPKRALRDEEVEDDKVVLDRYSDDEVYPASRNRDTIRQILRSASVRELELMQSFPSGIQFSFVVFQRVLQIKWNVIVLRRLENLLKNRVLKCIPKEWLDFDCQFAMIYGPMDESSGQYSSIIQQFKTGREELHREMLQRECQVWETMKQNPTSDYGSIALELEMKRLEFEAKLKSYLEANVDLNPFTNGLGLDFFVLPRPTAPIQAYKVRPVEMDKMIEFNVDEDDMVRAEGYNAAVIDVGCLYPQKIMDGEFRHILMRRKWHKTLCNVKVEMGAYPVGVESTVFINKLREKEICKNYVDDKRVLKASDVFFTQFLGKDERAILFQGVLEGIIITPEEILVRVWKRIKYLLELYHPNRIELEDLEHLYEMCFAQQLFTLQWGFGSISEFVEYSREVLGKNDMKIMKESPLRLKEAKRNETVDVEREKKVSEDGLKKMEMWMVLEEPVPANHTFKFSDPNPFDMML